jgi:serine/threonine protein kinase
MDRESWDFEQGDAIVPGRLALAPLGGGERYDTWLAWDEAMLAVVVAKVLRPACVDDPHARRELAAEADLALTLRHPIIVRGFDAVLDGPRPHLVLEHLEGPTLRSAVRRLRHGAGGRMTLEQVLPLGLHLCSALHYLGERGIVHLDIKPSNIVMGPVPRLIDLSVARTTERAASLRRPVGTRQYMAPEQADPCPRRRGEIGPAADMWAVGVCLYEALTGRRPYHSNGDDTDGGHPQVDAPPPNGPDALRCPRSSTTLSRAASHRPPQTARPPASSRVAWNRWSPPFPPCAQSADAASGTSTDAARPHHMRRRGRDGRLGSERCLWGRAPVPSFAGRR